MSPLPFTITWSNAWLSAKPPMDEQQIDKSVLVVEFKIPLKN